MYLSDYSEALRKRSRRSSRRYRGLVSTSLGGYGFDPGFLGDYGFELPGFLTSNPVVQAAEAAAGKATTFVESAAGQVAQQAARVQQQAQAARSGLRAGTRPAASQAPVITGGGSDGSGIDTGPLPAPSGMSTGMKVGLGVVGLLGIAAVMKGKKR